MNPGPGSAATARAGAEARLWLALVAERARADGLASQLAAITSSRSWKLTAVARRLASRWRAPAEPAEPATRLRATGVAGDTQGAAPELPTAIPADVREWIVRCSAFDSQQNRLWVDVTELDLEDLGAGIQRVTRRVLAELLLQEGARRLVVPVRLGREGHYCVAWRFCERMLGLPGGILGSELPVAPGPTDVFLGLDLCRRHHAEFGRALQSLGDAGVAIAVVVYDLLPWLHPSWFPPAVVADYRDWLQQVARSADTCICISQATRSDLVGAFAESASGLRAQVDVVPLGSDGLESLPRMPGAAPSILMVGTVEPRKGHADVLDAMDVLWAQGHAARLVLVGRPGWQSGSLHERIRKHPRFGTLLQWHESASDAELARHYAAAGLLVMASEGEGFGLPLAEAAHAGCPLLARDLPIFREVVRDRGGYFGNGRPLVQAIADFLANPGGWPDPMPGSWPSWSQCASAVSECVDRIEARQGARGYAGAGQ